MKSAGFYFCCLILITDYCSGQIKPHHYIRGDTIPELRLAQVYGDSINTKSLKGRKVLLMFNRYVSCPLCNYRAHELLEHYDTLKKHGLIIISVYESGKETLSLYTIQEEIPFIMIPDPDQVLYKEFKVRKSWWRTFEGLFHQYNKKHSEGKKDFASDYERDGHLNRIGADFLIDENGIVQVAYYGKFAGDHLPVDQIISWVTGKE